MNSTKSGPDPHRPTPRTTLRWEVDIDARGSGPIHLEVLGASVDDALVEASGWLASTMFKKPIIVRVQLVGEVVA